MIRVNQLQKLGFGENVIIVVADVIGVHGSKPILFTSLWDKPRTGIKFELRCCNLQCISSLKNLMP